MTVYIGTSGWQYRHWRGVFYPRDVPQRAWLRFYAGRFAVVEVNGTFYRLPKAETFDHWNEETPDDFRFAMKMSRFLTHIKRLREPEEPVGRFLGAAKGISRKLGPLLLQLPPDMEADPRRLDAALAAFPEDVRVAIEFRHVSWETAEVEEILRRYGAALCLADRGGEAVTPLWRTADWGYVRLHEGRAQPWPAYERRTLDAWVGRIGDLWGAGESVYVFFNNDPGGWAVHDAREFALAAEGAGLEHSRVPEALEIGVG